LHVFEQIPSRHFGHGEIEDEQSGPDAALQQIEGLLGIVGGQDGIPFAKEQRVQARLRVAVVLYDEDAVGVGHAAITSITAIEQWVNSRKNRV